MKVLLILLGILKGIGIVLLALLFLLLLIVLVVLLSPIKYRVSGEKKAELCGSFGVSWLFGAVKADGSYTPAESLKLKVKVLWFTLIGGEEKEKPKKKKAKKAKKPNRKKATKPAEQPDLQAAERPTPPPQKEKEPAKAEPEKQAEAPMEQKPKVAQQKMQSKQAKTVRRVKLSEIEEKPPVMDAEDDFEALMEDEAFFTGEEEKKDKIPPIVREAWSIEDKKGIFKALGKLLKRLMKGILPGNLFVKATVGTGDPTTTGYVLALAGILTAKFGNDIQIKGDFTKATAEDIEVRVKGKIILGQLLWAVLAFGLTKPVRKAIWKMIRFLRKKDKA